MTNTTESAVPDELPLAGRGRRLANSTIDMVAYMVMSMGFLFVVSLLLALAGHPLQEEQYKGPVRYLYAYGYLLAYYFVGEHYFGRTVGKWITGTRLVQADGSRPTARQILGRTLLRFVPFEAFTFFAANPVGMHDGMSGTRVIRAGRSDVAGNINAV